MQTRGVFAVMLLSTALSPAASGAADEFLRCTKLPTLEERHACYDEVARKLGAAEPADESQIPSYLTDAWKLGPQDVPARRLMDIMTYRPS